MGPAAAAAAAIAAAFHLSAPSPASATLRLPPVPPGPVSGYVLIADRNNNRVLIVSPGKRVVWRADGLRGPDDAFFTPGWRTVVTNEEFNDTLTEVSLRTGRAVWRYGHAGVPGSSAGYLNTPDDYRLADGSTTVADIRNGHTGRASSAPGYLSKPDGLDLLPASITTPRRGRRRRGAAMPPSPSPRTGDR